MPLQSSPTFNFNVETQEATKKSLPIIGKDGIYEVVDEDQYRYETNGRLQRLRYLAHCGR